MDLSTLAFEALTIPNEMHCGLSVLHAACISRDVDTVRTILVLSPSELDTAIALVLPAITKLDAHFSGKTTLELFKRWDDISLAKIQKTINRILKSVLSKSLLHETVRKGTIRQVIRLVELGADVNLLSLTVADRPAFHPNIPCTNEICPLPQNEDGCAVNIKARNSLVLNEVQGTQEFLRCNSIEFRSAGSFVAVPRETVQPEETRVNCPVPASFARDNAASNDKIAVRHGNVPDSLRSSPSSECTFRLNRFKMLFKRFAAPLHIATERQNLQMMELLIAVGANVNIQDEFGMTPLHLAARDGWVAGLKCLLSHAADVHIVTGELPHNPRFSYITALHLAAVCKHPDAIRVLLEHGAVLDVVSGEGATPFHWACRGDLACNVNLLTKLGCSKNGVIGRMSGTAVCCY